MSLYRDTGVVLRTYKLGEADRIVVILTAAHGKVRAVAKGVRKTKSRFGSRLEPMSHVSLLMYEGRELDIVSQAESIDHFRTLRDDLDGMTRAMSLLEVIDQIAQDRHPSPPYQMLLGARAAGGRAQRPARAGVLPEALAAEGVGPESTPVCGAARRDRCRLRPEDGGTLCRVRRGVPISEALARASRSAATCYRSREAATPATHEWRCWPLSMEHHLERRLRSLVCSEGYSRWPSMMSAVFHVISPVRRSTSLAAPDKLVGAGEDNVFRDIIVAARVLPM
jgi:DNA repair protein RecO (recombination protein O)